EACSLVEAGMGVALVDEFSTYGCEDNGMATRPFAGAAPLQASLIHMRYEPLSKPARAFISVLRQVIRERQYGQAAASVELDLDACVPTSSTRLGMHAEPSARPASATIP